MAERVYSKLTVDVPTVAMTPSDVTNPAPSTVQSAALNGGATTTAAQRVYKKKASLSAESTQPKRTYTPSLSIRTEQAKNAQTWFNDASSTIQSIKDTIDQSGDAESLTLGNDQIQRVNDLLTSADGIGAYIEYFKNDPKTYESLTTAFSEMKGYLSDINAAHYAPGFTAWGGNIASLSDDVLTYFEKFDDTYVPTKDEYNAMLGRIDSALSEMGTYRSAFATDPEVTDYLNDVESYLKSVRGDVEKYRGGLKGAFQQEMSDKLKQATGNSPLDKKYGDMSEEARVWYNNALTNYRMANADFYNYANKRGANAKLVWNDIYVGLAHFNQALYNFADWIIPDEWVSETFGLKNSVGQFFDDMNEEYDRIYGRNAELEKYASPAVAWIGNNVLTPVAEAVPNLVVTVMSGGAGAAAGLGASTSAASSSVIASTIKQPNFWLSFAQTGGSVYKTALDNGATEEQASLTALLAAFPSALVEVSGGVEKMPTEAGLWNFVKETLSEGGEEILQGAIEQAATKAVYEQEKQWFSLTDTDAVFSGSRALQEFAGGVTVGAVLGGGTKATQYALQSAQYAKIGDQFISGTDGLTIDKAISIGLNNAKGTDAYISATKIQQKVKNGEKVSAYSVGRMVVESQSQQAQISKSIENTVLTTAKALDIETEAAETVAAAAVALGQKVEFVSPEQMHNRYMAGEYVGDTDTVRLNAAELDTGKLISAVLAHEMVHAAEGTNQLQVLEKTVRRIVGDEKWNNLKAAAVQNYAAHGAQVVGDGTNEALAGWITQNLFRNKGFAEAVVNGDANVGNAFFYLIDRARRALAIKKGNPSARNLAMLERLFMQAIDARTHTGKEGVQGAFKGYDPETGLPIYESNFPKGTPKSAKSKRVLKLIQEVWSKEPIPLVVKEEGKASRKIEAQFDPTYDESGAVTDASKLMGGNRHGTASEQRVTLDLADDYYQIATDAVYNYSKTEEGKKTATHQGVTQWHYFINDILFQEYGEKETTPYRVTINVKERSDGHFVYSFSAERQNKGSSTRRTLHADVTTAESGSNAQPNTNVAQNATDVNTQSMQEGAGISAQDSTVSAQGALLSEESMAAVDNGTWRDIRAKRMAEGQSPSHGDAVTDPFTQGGHAADAATQADVEIDEDAVLREALGEPATAEQSRPKRIYRKKGSVPTNIRVRVAGDVSRTAEGALNESPRLPDGQTPPFRQGGQDAAVSESANGGVRSQVQGRKQVDVSDLKKTNRRGEQTNYDHDAAINRLETELGKDELLHRMYNATRMDRPKGTVEVDGRQVDAGAYMDAYERQLPDDVAALEKKISQLEKQRSDEILRMQQEGTLKDYVFGGLKLDLQLFAAQRKYDLLQLDPGESGTEVRQFYEKRLRGTDANHNDQLVEMLAGRNETYNPICNEETLAEAKKYLENKKKEERLIRRIGEYNNDDIFTAKEVAAATVLINNAINDGDLGEAADMIIGLSRKGTIAGRAVQAYSMMARMTPEGTLKAAIRTIKSEADTIICKGADEKLDVLADDIVKAIEEAEDNGLSSEEIIDRIRKGVVGKDAPVQFGHVPQDLANQVSEAMGTDVTGYTVVVSTEAMQAIVDGGANVETLVDTEAETLQIIVRDGADTDTADTADAQQLTEGKKRLPAKLTREELVQLLSEDLAAEKGTYFTQEQLYDLLWKVVEKGSNIPEQVRRYVLKNIRKDDGGLAQRIYEVYQKGDLNSAKMRRAMEETLELPHLTDEDLKWIVEKATEIQSLESEPVKQADAMEELYDYLGAKMHVSTLEMLAAWRKFGMLFNVKTHLRNIFSNAAYKYVRKADAAVAMAIERIFVKDESKRGAALGWSHTEHGQSIMPALQKQVELAVLEMQGRGPKYEQGSNPLKRHRKMFGTTWVGEKFNKASDWNSKRLEAEDIRFFRPAYIDALGQLMTARGETEITTELHDIAMQRALEATFRNRNYISEWLSIPRRGLDSDKEFVRVMASLYDIALPFINTPAAVAEQAVWHSPIGLIKGTFELINATKGKGSKDIATAINTFSKGITGTALFAIGFFLGKAGLFHVGFGRTEKERAADEMNGVQDGALVIGNFSISLDWLQPAASPLIVGASLATNMREKGWSASSMFGAVFDGTDSLFELTMLQSLYDVLGGYEAGPSGSLASIGENAVSQSTPTLVGQLARAIDPVQRKTKGDNAFETAVNKVLATIPGLTYLLDPELDVWGDEVYRTGKASTGSAALNAVQQFGIPSNFKIGTAKDDPISEEILRLYNTVEDRPGRAIPTTVSRDEAKEAGVDYVEINKKLGAANRLAAEAFINNEKAYTIEVETGELTAAGNPKKEKVTKYYRDMTDAQRADVLSNIYKGIKDGLIGEESEKSEDQLNDNQAYYRYIIEQSEGAGSDADAHPYKNDPVVMEILKMYEEPADTKVPSSISREEAEEAGGDYEELNAILDAANRAAVEEFVNNKKAYTIEVKTGKLTAHGNPQTKTVTKYYRDMTDEERRKILSRIYTNNKAGLVGDASEKTARQLTDNEKYYRQLLDRAREGNAAADDAEDDAYYRELLRRAKNGY